MAEKRREALIHTLKMMVLVTLNGGERIMNAIYTDILAIMDQAKAGDNLPAGISQANVDYLMEVVAGAVRAFGGAVQ